MRASLVLLAALVAVTYAAGQYYVPRSYYTIDSDGHETVPVPLRRLRRSLSPVYSPGRQSSADAIAVKNAKVQGGGSANADAAAVARLRAKADQAPLVLLGSSKPISH